MGFYFIVTAKLRHELHTVNPSTYIIHGPALKGRYPVPWGTYCRYVPL